MKKERATTNAKVEFRIEEENGEGQIIFCFYGFQAPIVIVHPSAVDDKKLIDGLMRCVAEHVNRFLIEEAGKLGWKVDKSSIHKASELN